jgi:hypothetical protein
MTTTKSDVLVLNAPQQTYWTQDYRQFVSIDPAFKNIGIRIERRSGDTATMVYFARVSLVDDDEDMNRMFVNLQKVLDNLHPYLKDSHFFLVEKQQPISNAGQVHTNSKVMRVFGHIMGVLMARYGNQGLYPLICEVSPKLKGKLLQFKKRFCEFKGVDETTIPKELSYAQTKATGVKIGVELLTRLKDQPSLAIIEAAGSKKDDLTDTVCQTQAFILGFYDIREDKIKIKFK